MTAQPQSQPLASKPKRPTVHHWIHKGSEIALCGEIIHANRKRYGAASQNGRTVCPQCETLRLIEAALGW